MDAAALSQLPAETRKFQAILEAEDAAPGTVSSALSKALGLAELAPVCEAGKPAPVMCGAELSLHERVYRCLECQGDAQSVLCSACFEMDKHRGHRVIVISSGGGCCDCGDDSAWSPAGFCSRHAAAYRQRQGATDASLTAYIPAAARPRIAGCCAAVLCYTAKTSGAPERAARVAAAAVEFMEHTLRTLGDGAVRLCTLVAKMAPSALGVDGLESSSSSSENSKEECKEVAGLLLDVLAERDLDLDAVLVPALTSWYYLMITDTTFKLMFLWVFMRHYHDMALRSATDTGEKRRLGTVLPLSVQVWSCKMMTLGHESYTKVGRLILRTLKEALVRSTRAGKFDMDAPFFAHSKFDAFVNDLNYILQRRKQDRTHDLFEDDSFVDALFDVLFVAPKSVTYRCIRTGTHAEFDDTRGLRETSMGFGLTLVSTNVCEALRDPVFTDAQCIRVCQHVVARLFDYCSALSEAEAARCGREDGAVVVVDYNTLEQPVWFNLTAQRVALMLLCAARARGIPLAALIPPEVGATAFATFVALWPVRLAAAAGQTDAGLWVRNGDTFGRAMHVYRIELLAPLVRDWDVVAMQLAAAVLEPRAFLTLLVQTFRLTHADDCPPACRRVLLRTLLGVLTCVQHHEPLVPPQQQIEQYVVDALAVADAAHSKLCGGYYSPDIVSHRAVPPEFDAAVAAVAVASPSTQGAYTLRADAWARLNIYDPRYTTAALTAAEERWEEHAKHAQLPSAMPPCPPVLSLGHIPDVPRCPLLLSVLNTALDGALDDFRIVVPCFHLLRLAFADVARGTPQAAAVSQGCLEPNNSGGTRLVDALLRIAEGETLAVHAEAVVLLRQLYALGSDDVRRVLDQSRLELAEKTSAAPSPLQGSAKMQAARARQAQMMAAMMSKGSAMLSRFAGMGACDSDSDSNDDDEKKEDSDKEEKKEEEKEKEKEEKKVCVFCLEESDDVEQIGYVQRSPVLSAFAREHAYAQYTCTAAPGSASAYAAAAAAEFDQSAEEEAMWMTGGPDTAPVPVLRTCAHYAHHACLVKHLGAQVGAKEFVCPACRRHSNIVLPTVSTPHTFDQLQTIAALHRYGAGAAAGPVRVPAAWGAGCQCLAGTLAAHEVALRECTTPQQHAHCRARWRPACAALLALLDTCGYRPLAQGPPRAAQRVPPSAVSDPFAALVRRTVACLFAVRQDPALFARLCSVHLAADVLKTVAALLHARGAHPLLAHRVTAILLTHFQGLEGSGTHTDAGAGDAAPCAGTDTPLPLRAFLDRYEAVFLRRCALLRALVFSTAPEGSTCDVGSDEGVEINAATAREGGLAALLGVDAAPTLDDAACTTAWWHALVRAGAAGACVVPRCVPFALAPLPAELTALLQRVEHEPCARCGTRPATPALCLLCGRICCFGGACCRHTIGGCGGGSEEGESESESESDNENEGEGEDEGMSMWRRMRRRSRTRSEVRVGECFAHALTCCNAFLLPNDVDTDFLRTDARYCGLGPVLYFDEHGEPDRSLKRGNPLFLSAEGLERVRVLVRDFLVDDMCLPTFHARDPVHLL